MIERTKYFSVVYKEIRKHPTNKLILVFMYSGFIYEFGEFWRERFV